jgi:hypothetical protein
MMPTFLARAQLECSHYSPRLPVVQPSGQALAPSVRGSVTPSLPLRFGSGLRLRTGSVRRRAGSRVCARAEIRRCPFALLTVLGCALRRAQTGPEQSEGMTKGRSHSMVGCTYQLHFRWGRGPSALRPSSPASGRGEQGARGVAAPPFQGAQVQLLQAFRGQRGASPPHPPRGVGRGTRWGWCGAQLRCTSPLIPSLPAGERGGSLRG